MKQGLLLHSSCVCFLWWNNFHITSAAQWQMCIWKDGGLCTEMSFPTTLSAWINNVHNVIFDSRFAPWNCQLQNKWHWHVFSTLKHLDDDAENLFKQSSSYGSSQQMINTQYQSTTVQTGRKSTEMETCDAVVTSTTNSTWRSNAAAAAAASAGNVTEFINWFIQGFVKGSECVQCDGAKETRSETKTLYKN